MQGNVVIHSIQACYYYYFFLYSIQARLLLLFFFNSPPPIVCLLSAWFMFQTCIKQEKQKKKLTFGLCYFFKYLTLFLDVFCKILRFLNTMCLLQYVHHDFLRRHKKAKLILKEVPNKNVCSKCPLKELRFLIFFGYITHHQKKKKTET